MSVDFRSIVAIHGSPVGVKKFKGIGLTCENICFSSFFAAGDVSREQTSATKRQKFHTDYTYQCLHNTSGSHCVTNINLSNFACLLVDFGKVLWSSANELQQNSNASFREDYISQILTALNLETFAFTFDLCGLLSFVCHLYTIAKTMQPLLRTISPSDRIVDRFTSLA